MIRKVKPEDKAVFLAMTDTFYHSDAVLHPVPLEVQERVFEEAISSDLYLEAYLFEYEDEVAGYAVINKSFSTEVGGPIVWIEDIYVKPEFRSKSLGRAFFAFLETHFSGTVKRFRLEVDYENRKAISLYQKMGFSELPYLQMVKDQP